MNTRRGSPKKRPKTALRSRDAQRGKGRAEDEIRGKKKRAPLGANHRPRARQMRLGFESGGSVTTERARQLFAQMREILTNGENPPNQSTRRL